MKLEVNDIIRLRDVSRKIVDVRDTGYTWIYPDVPEKQFDSENSNNPFFDLEEWEVVS